MEWSWKKVDELGSGTYGTVYLAYESGTSDQPIAVKSADNSSGFSSLEREATMFQRLAGAANVVKCYGDDESLENNKITYNLLLEFAPFGSLRDLIKKTGSMSEFKVACYAFMLLRGLNEMHSRGLIHCDLKSENVLVFRGPCDAIKELKLADLGLAKEVSEGLFKKIPTEQCGGKYYYNRGTPTTASPESVYYGYHGPEADVWSIGCIVYEMLTGRGIWNYSGDMKSLYEQILFENPRKRFPAYLSADAVSFLSMCLNRDVYLRWQVDVLMNHPFIVKNLVYLFKTFGIDLTARPRPAKSGWISTSDMFSERMNDGQLVRKMVQPPTASCYHENAAMMSSQSQLLV